MGTGHQTVEWEQENGIIEQVPIYIALNTLTEQTNLRPFNGFNMMFPELQEYCITPYDRRYKRNVNRIRAKLLGFIQERR